MKLLLVFNFLFFISPISIGQNCPDNINNSPGNSNNIITAIVYDSNGDEIDTIDCDATGNSGNIDCDLESHNFPPDVFIEIEMSNGTLCYYDEDGESVDLTSLPVELLSFTIDSSVDCLNILNWTTSSETNNDYFKIMYSQNGIDWSEVGKKEGAGNSVVNNDYTFEHRSGFFGTEYYKLIQYDYNGEYEILGVRSVVCQSNKEVIKFIDDQLHVKLDNKIERVNFFSYQGKKVNNTKIQEIGENYNIYELNSIYKGIIFVVVTDLNNSIYRRKYFLK